jgi:hypothetical protein
MKITEKKTITKEISVTTDVICNKCEKSIYKPAYSDNGFSFNYLEGIAMVEHTISIVNSSITFSVCTECLKEFTESFKIPPTEEWQTIIG